MTGIVNPGRELVGDQAAVGHDKKFERQDADMIKGVDQRYGLAPCLGFNGMVNACRHDGPGEDAVFVHVARRGPAGRLAGTGPRNDHRDFAVERDGRFKNRRGLANSVPASCDICRIFQPGLTLSVIPVAPCLQHAFTTQRRQRWAKVRLGIDLPIVRGGDTNGAQEGLFVGAILRHCERFRARMKGRACGGDGFHGADGDVLELKRNDVTSLSEPGQRAVVIIVGLPVFHGDARGRRICLRTEDMHVKAKLAGGASQHPAQLSAAKNPDHGAGRQACHPSGSSATAAVWAAR